MYSLLIEKDRYKIELKKASKNYSNDRYIHDWNIKEVGDDIYRVNENFFLCKTRKPLLEKARKLKEDWIIELKEICNRVENMKL